MCKYKELIVLCKINLKPHNMNKKILLVVDEATFTLVKMMLQDFPCSIIRETSVKNALELLHFAKFDLVISNVSLAILDQSNPDAMEFAAMIKALPNQNQEVKTLALFCSEDSLQQTGWDASLSIPLDKQVFQNTIKKLI